MAARAAADERERNEQGGGTPVARRDDDVGVLQELANSGLIERG